LVEVKVALLSEKQSISALIMRLMMFSKKDLVASKWPFNSINKFVIIVV